MYYPTTRYGFDEEPYAGFQHSHHSESFQDDFQQYPRRWSMSSPYGHEHQPPVRYGDYSATFPHKSFDHYSSGPFESKYQPKINPYDHYYNRHFDEENEHVPVLLRYGKFDFPPDDHLSNMLPGYRSPYTGKKVTRVDDHAHMVFKGKLSDRKKQKRLDALHQSRHELHDEMDRGLGHFLLNALSHLFAKPEKPQVFLPAGPVVEWTPITGARKALLIGINYTGQKSQLRGCANDVRAMEEFLRGRGFSTIEKLVDDGTNSTKPPTKINMLAAMKWLMNGAKPGDSLVFHYSGHGASQKDVNGDEADGMDETIIPMDYTTAGMIVDDEIYNIMCVALPQGARLTSVMDCCHSGTGMDLPYVKTLQGSGLQCEYKDTRLRGDAILFSGCKDSQTSADVMDHDVGYGAMTNAVLGALKVNRHQTYNQLLESIQRQMKEKGHSQIPQLSMSRNLNLDVKFDI